MKRPSTSTNTLISGILKLNRLNGERQNVLAFIQSCYCARVRDYDLHWAVDALAKLTDEEQHALIAWIVQSDDWSSRQRLQAE